jgi:hypothetical protein|tara:strand:- start:1764 stop:1970 length:207 start_codon:yes stop_codon:yes gene_type:complete
LHGAESAKKLLGVQLFAGASVAHVPQVGKLQIELVDCQMCRLACAALPLNLLGQRIDPGQKHVRCHQE